MKCLPHPVDVSIVNNAYAKGRITAAQADAAAKLLRKGWLDPFIYGRNVHLALPMVALRRITGSAARDWHRPTVRITPSGRLIAAASSKEGRVPC
jgi:hypothetical protein